MNRLCLISSALLILFLCSYTASFSQKKLLVLGSSTSSCFFGPSTYDSCYLIRLLKYYQNAGTPFILDNRAVAGDNCYHGMPTSYTPPAGRTLPRPENNITDGLKGNPDVVLVNYPSNGYEEFSVDEVMFCLRTIKQTANNSGIPCYVTTSQPRDDPEPYRTSEVKKKMIEIRNRVISEFGDFSINFWDDIVNTADTTIRSIYNADGTHLNDRGHWVFFNKVLEKNIFKATGTDFTPPSLPSNLKVIISGRNAVELTWENSADNVGVQGYEIYVNNNKQYTTSASTFLIENLSANTPYIFNVKAFDEAGNRSGLSNTVSVTTPSSSANGLAYRYYEGEWNYLPDFSSLVPVKTGSSANIDLGVKNREVNFGLLWEGYIRIPYSGTYTFEIVSDDGSRLYFNTLYSNTASALINNDGLHGDQSASSTINVNAGTYPVAIGFFQKSGLANMRVYWTGPGISRQLVPNDAFSNVQPPSPGLNYKYYEGQWNQLPDFSSLIPVKTGSSANIDLNVKNRNDSFGLVWEGYIHIPLSGAYTFEISSDDGSKLYFNSFYSGNAVPLLNNDGLHSDHSASATIDLTSGTYPIAMTFFENTGLENMKVYWTGPGIPRQPIPDEAFSTNLPPLPAIAQQRSANGASFNQDLLRADEAAGPAGVFPNPFLKKLNLRFYNQANAGKVEVRVYDLAGKLLFNQYYGMLTAGYHTLDIATNSKAHLKPGTYVLRLQVNDTVIQTWKIVQLKN